MKFLSYSFRDVASFGVATDDGVIDARRRFPQFDDLRAMIRADAAAEVYEECMAGSADLGYDDIEFLPTIPNPEKIICIGVNYANRNEEYKDGSKPPRYPSVFMRNRDEFVLGQKPAE